MEEGNTDLGGWVLFHLLASSKMSGSSLASFSLATSAIGPKMTTGLRNPAVQKQRAHCEDDQHPIRSNFVCLALKPLNACALVGISCKICGCVGVLWGPLCSYLPSAQPVRRQGTWSGPAGPTGPPCSYASSSWSFAVLGTSRSLLCLRLGFLEGCTAHWTAAQLWTGDRVRGQKHYPHRKFN